MRATWFLPTTLAVVLTGAFLSAGAEPPAQDKKVRNPFGAPDIQDPDGDDVQALAARVKLAGDDRDANAEPWVKEATVGKVGSLEGQWSDRWNTTGDWYYGQGPTHIRVIGDRVYVLVNSSNGQFLIDLKRTKNWLVGRYRGIDCPFDTGACVFLVVNNERIDGNWAGYGRWDFRRKLK